MHPSAVAKAIRPRFGGKDNRKDLKNSADGRTRDFAVRVLAPVEAALALLLRSFRLSAVFRISARLGEVRVVGFDHRILGTVRQLAPQRGIAGLFAAVLLDRPFAAVLVVLR